VDPLPPEKEEARPFEAPRGGARFVYVANSRRDTVAVIDSTSLGIRTVPVGDTPAFLTTVEGKDVALVLNIGSKDVSILRTDAAAVTVVARVPVVAGANRLSVARDGTHALAWYDASLRAGAERGAAGSFQEVSVITLAPGADAAVDMTVGFRPTDVVFSADGSGVFVVTEDGISAIRFAELKGPAVAPFVRLGDTSPGRAEPRDVSVTPDGKYAIARREGSSILVLVDLGEAKVKASVDFGAAVTDLDLAPAGDFAVAVLRAENAFVRLAIPAGFSDEGARQKRELDGETIGSASLSPDGKAAVFYTTAATPAVERAVIVDLAADSAPPLPVRLKKAVRAISIAPDGRTAVVLHTKAAGDPRAAGIDVETEIDRSYGYTVMDLRSGFAKLQITSADVSSLAITPDGTRAFVVVRDPGPQTAVRLVQRITLASFIVEDFVLGSPPVSLAVLAQSTKRVFVSQEHPEGRISFIQWETGLIESVTGFELNGRIVQ
jgi:YVTN family beta-propeller protein